MEIIKPRRLQKGDTVGIVSPSEYIPEKLRAECDLAREALEELDLKVKMGVHALDRHFYNAGAREARLEDFRTLWRDPEVKMILMSQGGDTANHLLDGIDYDMIRRDPKIFAGFSDGTTLVNAIFAKAKLVTYYGPSFLWGFSRPMSALFVDNFKKTFFDGNVGELQPNPYWRHEKKEGLTHPGWRGVRSGRASGILNGRALGVSSHGYARRIRPGFPRRDIIFGRHGADYETRPPVYRVSPQRRTCEDQGSHYRLF